MDKNMFKIFWRPMMEYITYGYDYFGAEYVIDFDRFLLVLQNDRNYIMRKAVIYNTVNKESVLRGLRDE